MANKADFNLVKSGTIFINDWRTNHPTKTLDLSGAVLKNIDLRGANLSNVCFSKAKLLGVDLRTADLSRSNWSKSNIFNSNLSGTTLTKINFSNANIFNSFFDDAKLIEANFTGAHCSTTFFQNTDLQSVNFVGVNFFQNTFADANLSKSNLTQAKMNYCVFIFSRISETDFSSANLIGSIFLSCNLFGSNLTNVTFGNTTFAVCDLTNCIGIGTGNHVLPNNIDLRTIRRSLSSANYCLKPEFETFLFASGFPKEFIQQIPKIFGRIKYYSAFICYGQPDIKFAKKLKKDLETRGVACWLYSLDAIPGERTWKEIKHKIGELEKMIILSSSESLIRDGVLKEIEEQIDEDREKIIPISLDNLWKQNGFLIRRGQRDLKPFLLERNYVDFSLESKYEESLGSLLKGLRLRKN